MTVLVHFTGPSATRSVALEPGAAPLDVGRDAQAAVHLPDQDRLISRRHLTLEWDQGGARLTVLSRNGVTTPRGDVSNGESIVLAPGESGRIGGYSFVVEAPRSKSEDPWAAFASEWVPPARAPAADPPLPPRAPLNRAFDDAFSSSTAWRVEEAPDPLASASFESDKVIGQAFSLPAATPSATPAREGSDAALLALCRGLGIAGPPQLAAPEWEQLGRSVRQLVQGLAQLVNLRTQQKNEMRAIDRTMLGPQETNPLQAGMPLDQLLHYLLFAPQGSPGSMPAQRALQESIADLRAHELASAAAVRAAVEGALRDFEPARLRGTLMQGRRSFAAVVDNARLWDLYTAHYHDKGEHLAEWLEQVLDRHFMPAYLREAERLRRAGQPQPPQRHD